MYGYTRARGNGVEGVHSNKRLIRQSFPICKWNAWYVHGVAREQASKEERLFDGNQAIQADQRRSALPDGFGFRRNHLHRQPEKSLLAPLPKKAGRNNNGRITTRHQGGGVKRRYRIIDFKRNKDGVPAKVATIEYDPNRSARIALLHYVDGEKRYILHPKGLKVGDIVMCWL